MDSPNPHQENLKRKRSTDDVGPPRVGGGGHPVTQINYLVRARGERLRLIEGDAESFGEVLGMIDDYEGERFFF